MSVQLLDKTRKINKLLHNTSTSKVVFNDICGVLVETLDSNVLVISRKGKILGVGKCDDVEELQEMIPSELGKFVDPMLNERFLGVLSTKENVNLETLGFTSAEAAKYTAVINPIEIAGERLGTVFSYRGRSQLYDIDDIIDRDNSDQAFFHAKGSAAVASLILGTVMVFPLLIAVTVA